MFGTAAVAGEAQEAVLEPPAGDKVLELAVEVAHSSLAHDRDVKLPAYARYGVPEVWLIDVEGRRMTTYRDLGPDGYRRAEVVEPPGPLAPTALPDAAIDLVRLFG